MQQKHNQKLYKLKLENIQSLEDKKSKIQKNVSIR